MLQITCILAKNYPNASMLQKIINIIIIIENQTNSNMVENVTIKYLRQTKTNYKDCAKISRSKIDTGQEIEDVHIFGGQTPVKRLENQVF